MAPGMPLLSQGSFISQDKPENAHPSNINEKLDIMLMAVFSPQSKLHLTFSQEIKAW
jgi:hypothetical protein